VRELLAHFRSIDAIQLASVEQIAAAPGMGPALARAVWEYFHPQDDQSGSSSEPEDGLLADLAS
jgi:excinuclease ABC subunit C